RRGRGRRQRRGRRRRRLRRCQRTRSQSMSRGYSRIIIVGNLGRDPEMRYTPSGTPVTNFSVAVNRRRPTGGGEYQDETDWYRVAVFGRMAEVADQYLVRGMKVLVDGQPQIRSFTGQDGVERTSIEINADN